MIGCGLKDEKEQNIHKYSANNLAVNRNGLTSELGYTCKHMYCLSVLVERGEIKRTKRDKDDRQSKCVGVSQYIETIKGMKTYMYKHTCMYVLYSTCIHVYMCTCIHVHMYTCTCTYMYSQELSSLDHTRKTPDLTSYDNYCCIIDYGQ